MLRKGRNSLFLWRGFKKSDGIIFKGIFHAHFNCGAKRDAASSPLESFYSCNFVFWWQDLSNWHCQVFTWRSSLNHSIWTVQSLVLPWVLWETGRHDYAVGMECCAILMLSVWYVLSYITHCGWYQAGIVESVLKLSLRNKDLLLVMSSWSSCPRTITVDKMFINLSVHHLYI